MTGQENIKINSLQERYRLASRQAVYDRINGLSIKPIKKGEITQEQLELLDRLDTFLKENPNAAIADFPKQPIVEEAIITKASNFIETADNEGSVARILAGVAEIVKSARSPYSPLAAYRELEEAAREGWVLPSAVVTELVGVSPNGEVFVRGSFVFNKVGRIGRQAAWKVSKL